MPPLRSSPNLDGQRQRRLADTVQATLSRYGYDLVETPIIEAADLFLTKAGDQIVSRLFTFERHNQSLALRPEFTATAAHDYVLAYGADAPVVRWQFSGPIFEDEPGRASARYQRFSMGAELIGLDGAPADSEVVAACIDGLNAVGVRDWTLVVGHVGLLWQLLARFNLDARTERFLINHLPMLKDEGKAALLRALERNVLGRMALDGDDTNVDGGSTEQILGALLEATQHSVTMGGRTQQDIVRRLLQKRQRASEFEQIVAAVDFLDSWGQIDASAADAFPAIRRLIRDGDDDAAALLSRWMQTIDLLDAWGLDRARIRIRPDLARSWDYYTGLVFEVYAGGGLHVAGGGRYDELIKLIGGAGKVPAVGFVYYPEAMLAATDGNASTSSLCIALSVEDRAATAGIRWARALRDARLTVRMFTPEQLPEGEPALVVQADETARYQNQMFSIDALDALLTHLNAT